MKEATIKAYEAQYKRLSRALVRTTWPSDVASLKRQLDEISRKIELAKKKHNN